MRSSLAAVSTLLLLTQTGCSFDFCVDYVGNADCAGQGGAAGATTTGAPSSNDASSTASGTSTTGISPTCTPSDPAWMPSETCGVFVVPGSIGLGTPSSPFGTVGEALATGRVIYLAEGAYEEATSFPSGTTVFGGLEADWTFDAAVRPVITAPVDQIPVRLLAGSDTTALHHLRIEARGAEVAGGSSIAMIIEDVPSVLEAVDAVAGNGKAGTDSQTPTVPITPDNPDDIKGKDGEDADTVMLTVALGGGAAVQNPLCPTSVGGKGGDGGTIAGVMVGDAGDGSGGAVFDAACSGSTCGRGGAGADNQGQTQCAVGEAGKNGADGDDGVLDASFGTLSAAGYIGPAPGDAMDGAPGQGGGGGGGEQGSTTGTDTRGASGSSGGAGGCGGKGAAGGGPGGSSIALVVLGAMPSMTAVILTAGDGGAGGVGADGQFGAPGGNTGTPGTGLGGAFAACPGGRGGQGGQGGHGAGGHGGHAVGIAFNGDAPATGFTVMARGAAGDGGTSSGNMGVSGQSVDVLDFVP